MKKSVKLKIHRDYPIKQGLSQSLTTVFPAEKRSHAITDSVKRIEALT